MRFGAGAVLVGALLAIAPPPDPAHGARLLTDAADSPAPVDIRRATARQSGPRLRLLLRTRGRVPIAELALRPTTDPGLHDRHLCLRAVRGTDRSLTCIADSARHGRSAFRVEIRDDGTLMRPRRLAGVKVRRPESAVLELAGRFAAFGLERGRTRIFARSDWTGEICEPVAPPDRAGRRAGPEEPASEHLCTDRAPDEGLATLRIVRPRRIGCTRDQRRVRRNGPRSKRRIALTFDDGPGPYTGSVLSVLRAHRVKATFYLLGQKVGAREALARRALRHGHELANHSFAHRAYPSSSDLRATSARIEAMTGFRPCTFRPPYGAYNGGTLDSAWRNDMSSILWDVDPQDWRTPGAAAIEQRVLSASRPGSIVLLHDAGGPRGQTVSALPGIIRGLTARGYRLVPVSKLLGERWRWTP